MDKLTELEKENRELIARIKSNADAQDRSMTLPPLDIKDREPGMMRRRIPSWVAVAAMLAGVVIGIAMPKLGSTAYDGNTAFNYADTCRSVAQDDVNLSLLITSL